MEKSGETYNNNLRRVFHFLTISVLSLIYGLSDWTWDRTAPALSIGVCSVILADLLRIHVKFLNDFVQKHFKFILRTHEFHTLSGSSWFLLSGLISIAIFPKILTVFGFLCLAAGDPIASYVGISATAGKNIGQKTWHGTWAFFLIVWLVGGLWLLRTYNPLIAFTTAAIGGFGAAVAERVVLELDDNLIIPLVASGLGLGWIKLLSLML